MTRMLSAPRAALSSVAGRLREGAWQRWLEFALLALLAFQCARLFWALLTPVGTIGPWEAGLPRAAAPSLTVLRETDPFFRAGPRDTVVVTSLDLTLHGVRQDQGGGRGSAIIATPDGQQHSFAVGDEIVPGVRLSAVAFDHVTLARGAIVEKLYMDQSGPAKVVGGAGEVRSRPENAPTAPAPTKGAAGQ